MKIRQILNKYLNSHRAAYIPFVPAGDQDMETTMRLIVELDKLGADIIELGVPFSDPVADGPTIAQSYERALKNNVTLLDCIALVKKLRTGGCHIPLVLFSYLNPIIQLGQEKFAKLCAEAGINSVLLVDLPAEESQEMVQILKNHGIGIILLVSPTTTTDRLNLICDQNPDFIYYISRKGVTGSQTELSSSLASEVAAIKRVTDIPVAVGFGISSKEQVALIAGMAEGYVVGSALVDCLRDGDKTTAQANFLERAKSLRI
ncbi:MAG: tryptophan synthase subunit alpha [Verrucomicrobia bacterium CG_4_10_14_3_um_filter_43_23]|nr:MAG: tryptophan synthase subunit alpha [Verrucomicrobia bacterium CG1_02_43_26]PIP59047.1 MAG: tryptophan synthase subunit alpha [Verrucomicrobia bacterium CG22_combo_CG10-13_8_21_14_all_43_17]PIX59144.1 MAG: tryptophan synthase subunit alpha [Verrucomicrobia bacterium CG_4_10_14_3_um_filter_43_23]PIY61334.1 MAG: tryptophan synthase subunit alpha [Verrucomicrobia bacterium CG_4_10_14_0_8_um_filter_43_34]PJA44115.1 MAG: tryptophan synthase subunit alpha [Verrucomicrobia bacterium CG_4_9_14_3_